MGGRGGRADARWSRVVIMFSEGCFFVRGLLLGEADWLADYQEGGTVLLYGEKGEKYLCR